MNDIWITGIGLRSAAGNTLHEFGQSMSANLFCGEAAGSKLDVSYVARVKETNGLLDVTSRGLFPDDRKSQLGWSAAHEALSHSGLVDFHDKRSVMYVGTGLSSITPNEFETDIYPHLIDGRLSRESMASDIRAGMTAPNRHLPHRFASCLAESIGHTGLSATNFSACAAAAQAIAEGFFALKRGEADVALVGGHDSMDHPMGLLSFLVLGALSPERCRPFDHGRNGFMLGEGAAMFILERAEYARERGAVPLAQISGVGTSIDANNATAPHAEGMGAALAMRRALRCAQLNAKDIGYVNAHGTGTPLGDIAESLAIHRVFGEQVSVSSIKGAIGHTIAAAGALEGVACVNALMTGLLPGTVGLNKRDINCPVRVLKSTTAVDINHIASNSFGFGGQNASLIFSKVEL